MLEGTELVAQLTAQYPIIEKTYARVNSEQLEFLRNSLEQLYVVILRFQIRTMAYFDGDGKLKRTLTGLNPVSADENRNLREAVDEAREKADHDISLVHAEVTQKGIDELSAGQSKQLVITVDGILALANKTGTAMREQKSLMIEKFHEADTHQSKRMKAMTAEIVQQWQEPLEGVMVKLEKEMIADEEARLVAIQNWLSVAQPEQDHQEARSKRPMHLGDWLLQHPKFTDWCQSDVSSIFWMYGLPGTGKTNLSRRVIDSLQTPISSSDQSSDYAK